MEFGMFNLFSIIFPIFFIAVLSIILYRIFQGLNEWSSNNKAPKITTEAIVVAKRTNISSHTTNSPGVGDGFSSNQTTHSTSYYVTFQLASGQRLEFHIKNGTEYGLLIEQDLGQLTYQGTRYLSFNRQF